MRYRRALAKLAAEYGLGLAAMGTFPLAYWPEQVMTRKARYGAIMDDLQMIGYRNMLCGMHVHVAVPDVDTRINLIMRLTAYLPLMLALTTSSPFWQGHLTGLVGYRLGRLRRTFSSSRELLSCSGPTTIIASLSLHTQMGQNHSGRELHLVGDPSFTQQSHH